MEKQYYLMCRHVHDDSRIEYISRFNTQIEAINWYNDNIYIRNGLQYFIQEVLEL